MHKITAENLNKKTQRFIIKYKNIHINMQIELKAFFFCVSSETSSFKTNSYELF